MCELFCCPAEKGKTDEELKADQIAMAKEYAQMYNEAFVMYRGQEYARFKGPAHEVYQKYLNDLKLEIDLIRKHLDYAYEQKLHEFINRANNRGEIK